jgi:hypothetical protein
MLVSSSFPALVAEQNRKDGARWFVASKKKSGVGFSVPYLLKNLPWPPLAQGS